MNHTGKLNHKLHISATIEDDDKDLDIRFYILTEEQFIISIPQMLQNAEGIGDDLIFEIKYESEQNNNPRLTIDVDNTQTLFVLFDNRHSWATDKKILSKIQEEWDEDGKIKNSAFVIMSIGNPDKFVKFDILLFLIQSNQ